MMFLKGSLYIHEKAIYLNFHSNYVTEKITSLRPTIYPVNQIIIAELNVHLVNIIRSSLCHRLSLAV